MIIKQISVTKYGPLNQIHLDLNPGIQPIYGSNESGKTLLLDFLTKKLAKKESWKKDEKVNRVTETPEGYIILEEKNQEIKLEKEKTLSEYLDVSSDEIRNIFLIRDSDLELPDEDRFYERMTDRLTGIRSKDIERIITKTLEIGRLTTKKKELSDTTDKAKSTLDKALKLKGNLEKYIEFADNEGIVDLEEKVFSLEISFNEKQNLRDKLEKAKKKDEYKNNENLIGEIEHLTDTIKKFPHINELQSLNDDLLDYKEKNVNQKELKKRIKYLKYLFFLTIPFGALTWLLWVFVNSASIGLISPLLQSLIMIISGIFWIFYENKLAVFSKEQNLLKTKAKTLSIETSSFDELNKKVTILISEIKKQDKILIEKRAILRNELQITNSDGSQNLTQIARKKLENIKGEIDFKIKLTFNEEVYKEARGNCTNIRDELDIIEERLESYKAEIRDFEKEARKIDFRSFTNNELELEITNIESLKKLIEEINTLCNVISSNEKYSKIAIEIFEEILVEEKEKIAEIFGKDSKSSQIFAELTDGRYSDIRYDNQNSEVIVIRPSGKEILAKNLSKGTFDQLYLALRIDLAQRILKNKKAFFIMDDTFLAASRKRFENGKKVLEKLAKSGWQVIYFSAKDIDSEELSVISGNEVIMLDPLP